MRPANPLTCIDSLLPRTEVERGQAYGQGAADFPVCVARSVARVATLQIHGPVSRLAGTTGPAKTDGEGRGDQVTTFPVGGNHLVRG